MLFSIAGMNIKKSQELLTSEQHSEDQRDSRLLEDEVVTVPKEMNSNANAQSSSIYII